MKKQIRSFSLRFSLINRFEMLLKEALVHDLRPVLLRGDTQKLGDGEGGDNVAGSCHGHDALQHLLSDSGNTPEDMF